MDPSQLPDGLGESDYHPIPHPQIIRQRPPRPRLNHERRGHDPPRHHTSSSPRGRCRLNPRDAAALINLTMSNDITTFRMW